MHTSTVLRRLTVGAGALALVAGLAGCEDTPDPTGGLAIVVGAHSNMPRPSLDGDGRTALDAALRSESYLAVVVADGSPFVSMKGSLLVDHANSVAEEQDRARNQQQAEQALTAAAAQSAETDLLSALHLAGRSVTETPGDHTIVVVDSGLSTVAPLDFTQPGLLDAQPADVVASLTAAHELPDLAGMVVVLQGIGDTALPQRPLSHGEQANLRAIWTAVVEAAGAEVHVVESPLSGEAAAGLPPVSVVEPSVPACVGGTVTLAGGDVAFQPDSAVLLDRSAAAAVIQPIAQQLVDRGVGATVTGTTADVGDAAGQVQLSTQRAQAVADLLVSSGVPAERIDVVGLGSDFPGYVQDHDATGALDPSAAALNRKVIIDPDDASTDLTCTQD